MIRALAGRGEEGISNAFVAAHKERRTVCMCVCCSGDHDDCTRYFVHGQVCLFLSTTPNTNTYACTHACAFAMCLCWKRFL